MEYKKVHEIAERCRAATPGRWSYDGMHNEIHCHNPEQEYFLICSELREHPGEKLLDEFGHTYNPDFDFIAHARQDIPDLLDEVEHMQKYKAHSKMISALPSCNDCALAKTCGFKPELGRVVRINCHMHMPS